MTKTFKDLLIEIMAEAFKRVLLELLEDENRPTPRVIYNAATNATKA